MQDLSPSPLAQLRRHLAIIGSGSVDKNSPVLSLLTAAWDELSGGNNEGMKAEKVARADALSWQPPCLTFRIERHGGTVKGSKRAEIHEWTINVENGMASCAKGSFRQLTPNAPPYTKVQAAEEATAIGALIVAGKDSPLLKRYGDGSVRVFSAVAVPSKNAPKQTLSARRKRLKKALVGEMAKQGWRLLAGKAAWTFSKGDAASG